MKDLLAFKHKVTDVVPIAALRKTLLELRGSKP